MRMGAMYSKKWNGGNNDSLVSSFKNSGSVYRFRYSWDQPGLYRVKVKAIDEYGF